MRYIDRQQTDEQGSRHQESDFNTISTVKAESGASWSESVYLASENNSRCALWQRPALNSNVQQHRQQKINQAG